MRKEKQGWYIDLFNLISKAPIPYNRKVVIGEIVNEIKRAEETEDFKKKILSYIYMIQILETMLEQGEIYGIENQKKTASFISIAKIYVRDNKF